MYINENIQGKKPNPHIIESNYMFAPITGYKIHDEFTPDFAISVESTEGKSMSYNSKSKTAIVKAVKDATGFPGQISIQYRGKNIADVVTSIDGYSEKMSTASDTKEEAAIVAVEELIYKMYSKIILKTDPEKPKVYLG